MSEIYNFEQLGRQISEVDHVIDRWIKKLGLNYNSYAVLYSLASSEDFKRTQKQICEDWMLPKQTVFNVCKEFREKGWIELTDSPNDRRERVLCLTSQGKVNAMPVLQATQILSERTFNLFGEERSARLFTLLAEFCEACGQEIDKMTFEEDASCGRL